MEASTNFDQPEHQVDLTPLSDADASVLAELLGEGEGTEPDPLADLKQGDAIVIRGRTFWALARAPRRLALMGACCECGFPFVESGSPRPLVKRMPKACPRHRPRLKRAKRGQRRIWTAAEIGHEITQQRATPGKYTATDFILRGGHGYAVQGVRQVWSDRAGKHFEIVDLVGLCAECGELFGLTQTMPRLENVYQVRRCPKHRSSARAPKPKPWTRELYRQALRMAR